MSNGYEEIEKEVTKKAEERARRKRERMKVSGKSVFGLIGKTAIGTAKKKMTKSK